MRTQPRHSRRIPGPRTVDKDFQFEAPPELPRLVELPAWRKALPWVFGLVMAGMVVMMIVSGFRQMNPMYLFFMLMMGIALFTSMQNSGGGEDVTTPKVNAERAEYLRYLSGKAEQIREAAATQRAAAEWSHPDPDVLEAVFDSKRLWERFPTDADFLQVRIGRDQVQLANKIRVKPVDAEIDLEPVTKMGLQHLRAVQQVIPHCPKAIDLSGYGQITVYGERETFRAAVRAWVAQLVCWHNPNNCGLAVVSPDLEKHWGWAKWLPHTESQDIDGAGPARYLATSLAEVEDALEPLLKERAKVVDEKGNVDTSEVNKSNKQMVVIIDDPTVTPAAVRKIAGKNGVTVISYRDAAGPDRDYEPHERELLLRLQHNPLANAATVQMDTWKRYSWQVFCAEPDVLTTPVAEYLARRMSKWDAAPISHQDAESQAAQTLLALLGIPNAAKIDVEALWKPRMLPVGTGEPVILEPILKAPMGVQPNGAPLLHDLKDEADGGFGPHGLMIGMTGSGKSTALAALAFAVFAQHSPDVVQAILADFKDGAGFETFAGYPHVAAIITNMEEKKSHVERFGDTLLGLLDLRGRIFHDAGMKFQGAPFTSIVQYNEARATPAGAHLPPVPYMLVWVDEFSLLLKEHPELADVFDTVTRKGRSQGVYFLFASQTLDPGTIKDIDKNTQYRIGLKVASPSISRQVIGTEDAYHIPDGKNTKGTGYFVRAPGAQPVKFRSFMLPGRYEPPTTVNRRVITADPRARVFTAARVEPDPETVIEEEIAAESVIEGPPRSLVLTVGPQLAAHYGNKAPQLWAPPLDDPIPLDKVLTEAAAAPERSGGPWWPLGEIDMPRQLTHGVLNYSADDGNILLLAKDTEEASMVVQTFILSAASRYSPTEVGFFAFGYGGPGLGTVKDLPHMGAIGGRDRNQLNVRLFADLDAIATRRRQLFEEHNIGSLEEYRRRRRAGEAALDDGYPIDLFVIVDGYEGFVTDNVSLMNAKNPFEKNLDRLAGAGRGIHLMVTAASWIKLSNEVNNKVSVTYELKLSNPSESTVRARVDDKMMRPQDRIPVNQPGRGITKAGQVIRFAVGRTDGQATMNELDVKVRETVAALVNRYANARAVPAPQLLPTYVSAAKLPQLDGERYAVGVRGRDLQPLVFDFAESPLLAVYGDDHHGKTPFIDNMVRSVVTRRRGPDDAIVCIFDRRKRLKGLTRYLQHGEDYYEQDFEKMAQRIMALAQVCDQRKPPAEVADSWDHLHSWTFDGPKIYLFVDDLDVIPNQLTVHEPLPVGAPPGAVPASRMVQTWQPLLRHLATAGDVGLRVIVTHLATQLSAAEMNSNTVPGVFATQNANRLLLGSSAQNDKVRGVKFERLAPGRGYLVAASQEDCDYVQLAAPYEELLPQC
ncbi:type VII secretion protein EccCa [Mycolicibacterium fortuitum]|uniref:type VII secretion protein EccCa n=1 Tax=Mycolicibacterium fortuitum TaxID=1766 RepID=UPI003AAA44C3